MHSPFVKMVMLPSASDVRLVNKKGRAVALPPTALPLMADGKVEDVVAERTWKWCCVELCWDGRVRTAANVHEACVHGELGFVPKAAGGCKAVQQGY